MRTLIPTPRTQDAIIEVAQRDTDYSLTPNSITIPRGKVSGTTTITIDPRDRERETNVAAVKFNLGGSPDSFSAEDDGTTDNPSGCTCGIPYKRTPPLLNLRG